jgi:hypothetical protein
MEVKTSAANCFVYVLGVDMNCPLCGVLVRSGEPTHHCEGEEKKPPRNPRKKAGTSRGEHAR